jgi:hypothetical protein
MYESGFASYIRNVLGLHSDSKADLIPLIFYVHSMKMEKSKEKTYLQSKMLFALFGIRR